MIYSINQLLLKDYSERIAQKIMRSKKIISEYALEITNFNNLIKKLLTLTTDNKIINNIFDYSLFMNMSAVEFSSISVVIIRKDI